MQIGIIAEDKSDFESLKIIIHKINNRSYKFKPMVGRGAGRIISKCHAWSNSLKLSGCTRLVLLQDSDGKSPESLKKTLNAALSPCPIKDNIIVIAVEELEGWLLSDKKAIHTVFCNSGKLPLEMASPENISNPKEHLTKFVKSAYKKTYINTVHNVRIAKEIDIQKIKSKCSSFAELYKFFE